MPYCIFCFYQYSFQALIHFLKRNFFHSYTKLIKFFTILFQTGNCFRPRTLQTLNKFPRLNRRFLTISQKISYCLIFFFSQYVSALQMNHMQFLENIFNLLLMKFTHSTSLLQFQFYFTQSSFSKRYKALKISTSSIVVILIFLADPLEKYSVSPKSNIKVFV